MKIKICCGLENYAQVISSEMMEVLKESAQIHGISLDMEIALRLTAYMVESDLVQDSVLSQQILRLDFSEEQAIAECKRKRKAALYIYEMEKLKLFLQFEHSLPRHIKENFTIIDVKKATEAIKTELAIEKKSGQRE